MTNNLSQNSLSPSAQVNTEAEFLHVILDPAHPYVWSPSEPIAPCLLEDVATAGESLDITEEEATEGWQTLSVQLESLWATPSLSQRLDQKFANRLPSDLIEQISVKAQQVMASGRPLAEQLITCVQEMLVGWDPADLQVIARPLAYSMRGQEEILDVTIESMRNTDWETLSPIDQARISLAAARYAIDCLNQQVNE